METTYEINERYRKDFLELFEKHNFVEKVVIYCSDGIYTKNCPPRLTSYGKKLDKELRMKYHSDYVYAYLMERKAERSQSIQ